MPKMITVPSATSPDVYAFTDMLHNRLSDAGYYVPTAVLLKAMTILTELADGPRYEAVMLSVHDSLGNPAYVVKDNRTGATVETYEGYFAGQDARNRAISENVRESAREERS